MVGVTPAVITKKFPEAHPAVLQRKIDLEHEDIKLYIEQRKTKLGVSELSLRLDKPPEIANSSVPAPPREVSKQELPEELAALTLAEIVEKYGHLTAFKAHVNALKELESYRAKQMKFAKDRGDLIDKELEGNLIFEILEGLFKRLVQDVPLTVTQRVISIVKKNDDDMEMLSQREYQAANSRALKVAKSEMIERLGEQEKSLLGA
jgi:hypothetical protein